MKKTWSIFLALALIFSLAACAASENDPGTRTAEPISAEEQIALMVANQDQWLIRDSAYVPFYAVTDLDGNGRLELIRCMPGDDWWSTDTFFAVNEDCSGLEELAFPFGEEHSHPDLVDQDQFRMYTAQEGRYLIAKDDIYMGPVQASDYRAFHVLDCLTVTDEGVEAGDLAWCMMQDEDTNGDGLSEYHIYYYTGGDLDEEIDGEGYVNAPSERFPGYKEEVCSIAWWSFGEETEMDEDALTSGLSYSWDGFSVEPDAEVFDSLVEDPY